MASTQSVLARMSALAGVAAIAAAVLAGCTSNKPGTGASVTSDPGSSASSATGGTSPTSTPKPAIQRDLGGSCEEVLPVTAVNDAVGLPIIGKTSFIVDIPDKKIGRLARIDCQYGIGNPVKGKPAPKPKIEVAVNLYNSATRAKQRIADTVEFYLENGGQQHAAMVGPLQATVLTGYGQPTLVVTSGQRTVAVSADPKLTGNGSLNEIMSRIAQRALVATNP